MCHALLTLLSQQATALAGILLRFFFTGVPLTLPALAALHRGEHTREALHVARSWGLRLSIDQ